MSFEFFDKKLELPFQNCNCCASHSKLEKQGYYNCCKKNHTDYIQGLLLIDLANPVLFPNCNQDYYLEENWSFHGHIEIIEMKRPMVVRDLFQEFKKISKAVLTNHMMQLAFNIHLLDQQKVSEKLKIIYNILKSKPEIIIGTKVVQKFEQYCHERDHFQGLEQEVIQYGKDIFEQYINSVFFDIRANPILEFPLIRNSGGFIFSHQYNHFLIYYKKSEQINVDIYDNTGQFMKKITQPTLMIKDKVHNIQVILTEDLRYIVISINYYDYNIFEFETTKSKYCKMQDNFEENRLFQIDGSIFVIANKKIWNLNIAKLEFEICLDFKNQQQNVKSLGGHSYQRKNLNLLFFTKKQDDTQSYLILKMTNLKCNQPLKLINYYPQKMNEEIVPNSFLTSEQNDLIFIIQKYNEHAVINQHSFACKKKLRSFKVESEFKTSKIRMFLYQNSSKLAFVNNAIMKTYNLKTGKYIFTLVSNEMNHKFDQQFQIIDQNYLIKAGSQGIQAWYIINS